MTTVTYPIDPNACETCGYVLRVGDYPFCPHGSTRPSSPFPSYTVEIGGEQVLIDSAQKGYRIERELEKQANDQAKDSRGKPVAQAVFRLLHQNPSNLDKPCFEPPRYERPRLRDERGNPLPIFGRRRD